MSRPASSLNCSTIGLAREASTSGGALTLRLDPCSLSHQALRDEIYLGFDVTERVFLCGRQADGYLGISVVRTGRTGGFAPAELDGLTQLADCVVALAARHAELCASRAERNSCLQSVASIEPRLAKLYPALTDRERQVCARVLFGCTSEGISLELGIAEETVASYRKRAYHRLAIGTRHELLRAYLGHPEQQRGT